MMGEIKYAIGVLTTIAAVAIVLPGSLSARAATPSLSFSSPDDGTTLVAACASARRPHLPAKW